MALILPIAAVNTTNLDSASDRPDLARADLLDAVQKINSILANISTAAGAGLLSVRDTSGKIAGDILGTAATAKDPTGTGTLPATAETGMRFIRGAITSSGSFYGGGGSGVTVARTGAGAYTLTYSPAFTAQPVVVATVGYQGYIIAVNTSATATTAAYVTIKNAAGANVDCDFNFMAMGK